MSAMKAKALFTEIAVWFLALCLSAIFVSASFAEAPETMLIGKWKGREGATLEFVKDGILVINNQEARYRIIDKEKLEFIFDIGKTGRLLAFFSGWGLRPISEFTVSDDELILTLLASPNLTEKFQKVKKDAPVNDADEYFNRGLKNFKQGNYREAIKDYNKAIELDPKNAMAYNNRDMAYIILTNPQQAIKDFERAIQMNPELVHIYLNIALCYSLQNNAAMACQWLEKAIEKGYKNWDILRATSFNNIRNTSCYQEIVKSISQ